MDVSIETTAAVAATVAAGAAIWQGVLTRAAIKTAYDNSIAQERLVRLSALYTTLQELRQVSRLLDRKEPDDLTVEDSKELFGLVYKVREQANLVALAYPPGVFSEIYSEIADFIVWVSDRSDPPEDASTLAHISETASRLSSAVFELSSKLNMLRKS